MTTLTAKQQQLLRQLARYSIEKELGLQDDAALPHNALTDSIFSEKRGVFVTLHKNKELRGCIGSLTPHESIRAGVQNHAVHAAFHDHRFPPVTIDELAAITIEISILTEPKPLFFTSPQDLLQKLHPGQDGVTLSHGHFNATFLPQVWEQLPEPHNFMQHLALKAGLQADDWQKGDVEISTYTVLKF